jgi:hypothetical protein
VPEAVDGRSALRMLLGSRDARANLLVIDMGLLSGLNGRQVAFAAYSEPRRKCEMVSLSTRDSLAALLSLVLGHGRPPISPFPFLRPPSRQTIGRL